ncbi:MAG: hypothetical protein ACFFER_13910 [Candidatus Thorarchaeota archaeon]
MTVEVQWPRKWNRYPTPVLPREVPNQLLVNMEIPIDADREPIAEDRTKEYRNLILQFHPEVAIIGRELQYEINSQNNSWFYRVLERKGGREICIQYLLIFLKQSTSVSTNLMLFLPLILFLASVLEIVSISIFPPILVYFIAFFVCIILTYLGLKPHVDDWNRIKSGSRLRLRPTTVLFFLGPFQIPIFLQPYMFFSPGLYCFLLLVMIFLRWRNFLAHEMDYAPIFVWVEKTNDESWEFKKAHWDYFHYYGEGYEPNDEDRSQRLKDNRNIRLAMESPWHDFSPNTKPERRHYTSRARRMKFQQTQAFLRSIWFMLLIAMAIAIVGQFLGYDFREISINLVLLLQVRLAYQLFKSGREYIFGTYKTIHPEPSLFGIINLPNEFDRVHLSEEKIKILWNWPVEEGRLLIVSRLQNPFDERNDYFFTFRD